MWRRSAPAGAWLVILVNEKTSAAKSAAPNSCTGRRGKSAGVHLAGLSSDLKSATGPRCVSLSGLTIELMLVIKRWLLPEIVLVDHRSRLYRISAATVSHKRIDQRTAEPASAR